MTDAQTARGEELELFATCPKGFEAPLAAELAGLGAKGVRALHGQVAFAGTLADAYRVCLWSRIASRVMLVLGHGAAANADELLSKPDVDGGLIGGASLKPADFAAIVAAAGK